MPTALNDLLSAYQRKELSRDAFIKTLLTRDYTCIPMAYCQAVNRLAHFYSTEQLNKKNTVFGQLMDAFLETQTLEPVVSVSVMCREPEGELGEMYLYEVSPKSLTPDDPEQDWNKAVCNFMWTVTATNSYKFFLLSHAPESRVPPHSQRIASMSAAQIEAKQRAVRFLLTSVFSQDPTRLAKLNKDLGTSPWKHMIQRTQMFGRQQHTIGYIRAVIDLQGNMVSLSRSIMHIGEINSLAVAHAALYLNYEDEFLLLVTDKTTMNLAVFVVAKNLLTIDGRGDAICNSLPKMSDLLL